MATVFQVVGVGVVIVGFALERYGAICLVIIKPVEKKPCQPFDYVEDVERDKEQLALLSGVDRLVVYEPWSDMNVLFDKKYAEQVYGGVFFAKRQNSVPYNLHIRANRPSGE